MLVFNRFRISAAIFSQVAGLGFLLMSLSLYLSQSDGSSAQEQNAFLFNFGLCLFYGFAAMFVSWLATFSLARSVYRSQVQTLCCSGVAISVALLSLSCVN